MFVVHPDHQPLTPSPTQTLNWLPGLIRIALITQERKVRWGPSVYPKTVLLIPGPSLSSTVGKSMLENE